MTTQEQAQRRAVFYAALRSGDYTQLKKEMRFHYTDGSSGHCCLGVAQELYENDPAIEPDTKSREDGQFRYRAGNDSHGDNELTTLSDGAVLYYGFADHNPDLVGGGVATAHVQTASVWNDGENASFEMIADMFEQRYPAVADEDTTSDQGVCD